LGALYGRLWWQVWCLLLKNSTCKFKHSVKIPGMHVEQWGAFLESAIIWLSFIYSILVCWFCLQYRSPQSNLMEGVSDFSVCQIRQFQKV
jgi:hypothetical protein